MEAAKFALVGCSVIPWYMIDPPPSTAPHIAVMPFPSTASSTPAKGAQLRSRPRITLWSLSQAVRLSMVEKRGKVSALGSVGQRRPRSRTRVGTPAWASRSAVTPPPKPEPTTTARSCCVVVEIIVLLVPFVIQVSMACSMCKQCIRLFAHGVDFVVLLVDKRVYFGRLLFADGRKAQVRKRPANETENRQDDKQGQHAAEIAKNSTSTHRRKSISGLHGQRSAGIGPSERLGGLVKVGDERQNALLQRFHRCKVAALDCSAYQDTEPDLDLIEPGGMFGHIHKLNPVARIAQEGGAARQRLQNTALAFFAQVVGDRTALSDQSHQTFRLMGVELVADEQPHRIGIRIDGLGDMRGEVGFRAPRPQAGCDDLAGGNIEVGDQAQCAVTNIFKLAPFLLA